jgi:hypothetical protein
VISTVVFADTFLTVTLCRLTRAEVLAGDFLDSSDYSETDDEETGQRVRRVSAVTTWTNPNNSSSGAANRSRGSVVLEKDRRESVLDL